MNEYSFIIKAVFPLSSPNPKKAEKPQAAPKRLTFIRKQGIFESTQGLAVPDHSPSRPRPEEMSDYSFLIDFPASGSYITKAACRPGDIDGIRHAVMPLSEDNMASANLADAQPDAMDLEMHPLYIDRADSVRLFSLLSSILCHALP